MTRNNTQLSKLAFTKRTGAILTALIPPISLAARGGSPESDGAELPTEEFMDSVGVCVEQPASYAMDDGYRLFVTDVGINEDVPLQDHKSYRIEKQTQTDHEIVVEVKRDKTCDPTSTNHRAAPDTL